MAFRYILLLLSLISAVPSTFAIPPPQLFLPILQGLAQFLGILLASTIAYLSQIWQFMIRVLQLLSFQKKMIFGVTALVLIVSGVLVTWYGIEQQRDWQETLTEERLATISALKSYENITNASLMKGFILANFYENETEAARRYFSTENAVDAQEFERLKRRENPVVVDIRDRTGWKTGRIPGSVHSRLADFIRGEWKEIVPANRNQPVIVVCYAGTTGALTAEFLREKGYKNTYFLEGGMIQAYNNGITVNGSPYFGETLSDSVRVRNSHGAMLQLYEESNLHGIDVRPPFPERTQIINSTPFFRELRTSEEVNSFISKLSKEKLYYSICDSTITCYSAKVMNYELQQQQRETIGIFDISDIPKDSPLIQ